MAFTACLAQMTPVLGQVESNLELHVAAIDAAAAAGADLVVFPELSLTGYFLRDLVPDVALPLESPVLAELAKRSAEIAIVAGFVEETPDFNFHGSAAYFEAGRLRHVHRKTYLPTYGMFDEERYFGAGDTIRAFDTALGRTALVICEELWHPSLIYLASCDRMQQLVAIANSPARGAQGQRPGTAETYQRMLSVYAELFQVHVLFCNRVGCEEGVTFWGGSVVVGPDGQTIAQAPYLEEARLTAEIDPGLVRRERARTQLLSEERIDLTLRELQRIARERFGTEPTTP